MNLTSRPIALTLAALLIAGCADDDGDGSKQAAGASSGAVGSTGAAGGTGGAGGSAGAAGGETGWTKGSPCVAELVPFEVGPEGYAIGAIPGGSTAVLGCFTTDSSPALSRADRKPGPTCAGIEDAPCVATGSGSGTPCTHACLADEDCGANQACLCYMGVLGTQLNIHPEGTANKCIPAECNGPQDCDGWACGYSHQSCRGNESFHCRGPNDDCQNSEDCAGAACLFSDQDGKWMCMSHGSCQ